MLRPPGVATQPESLSYSQLSLHHGFWNKPQPLLSGPGLRRRRPHLLAALPRGTAEPQAAQRPQQLPLQTAPAERAPALPSTRRAPGSRSLGTYCIALLIGDRLELGAIVERGVNPTPLICRLPEWPEAAGRMQGEQQQSREQRREEGKIKRENKKSRRQYSKNSCSPGGREPSSVPALGRGAFLIRSTYVLPASWGMGSQPAAGPCSICSGGGHTFLLAGTDF